MRACRSGWRTRQRRRPARPPTPRSPTRRSSRRSSSSPREAVRAASGSESGSGAGIIVNANGTILTALHVVDGADSITVCYTDGTYSPADDRAASTPENDIATLAPVRPARDRRARGARRRRAGRVPVFAVGHPLGLTDSLSAGVVSALDRIVTVTATRRARAPHPDRRGGQPRQLRRPAAQQGRPGGRHRHRRSPTPADAGLLRRDRLRRAHRHGRRRRRRRRNPVTSCRDHAATRRPSRHDRQDPWPSDGSATAPARAGPLRGQADHRRAGRPARADARRAARPRPPPRRGRPGPGQDDGHQDARRGHRRRVPAASSSPPTSCPPTSSGRASTTSATASSRSRSARSSPTSSSPTRSTARRPRSRAPCSRSCRSGRSPSAARPIPLRTRSSSWPRRTRSSRRAPTPLPEAQVDRFMLKVLIGYPTPPRSSSSSSG